MSAFDDEFGLFGDEESSDEERRPLLGARQINSGETIIDDIEPEDEGSSQRRARPGETHVPRRRSGGRRRERGESNVADAAALPRASELLAFLAKRLVAKPEAVEVIVDQDAERGPLLELEVDHADLGKVIGRGGRVAQALRTLVRASAEGRVTVEIVDSEELDLEAVEGDVDEIDRFEAPPEDATS